MMVMLLMMMRRMPSNTISRTKKRVQRHSQRGMELLLEHYSKAKLGLRGDLVVVYICCGGDGA